MEVATKPQAQQQSSSSSTSDSAQATTGKEVLPQLMKMPVSKDDGSNIPKWDKALHAAHDAW